MSHETRLRELVSTNNPDVTLAKLGLLGSVLALGLRLFAAHPYILVIPLSTGTACALYLATRRRRVTSVELPHLAGAVAGYLPSLVVAGLAGYVWLVWAAGGRTLPAYLLAGAVGTGVLAQILLVDDDRLAPGLLLFQILLAALVVRLAPLFVTPGYVGVDIWSHVPVFVEGIVEAGSLSAIADVKYVMAPVYHLFVAVATLVFGSARPALYLTLGLVVPLSALFVYGAAGLLAPARWALLATALYAFADHFIRWGMQLIPTSLGLVFFLGLVYAVTRIYVGGADRWVVVLLVGFSLAIVFTHQVSTAITLVFLGVASAVVVWRDLGPGWPGVAASSGTAGILVGTFLLSLGVTLISWANTPIGDEFVFLWRMIDTLVRIGLEGVGFLNLASDPAPATTAEQTLLDLVVPYVELVGFGLLLAIAVVGGLVMLRWERPFDATLTYVLSAGAMFVVVFGLSLFGLRTLLPHRWIPFMYAFMVILGAVGVQYVFQTASRRVILAVVVVLALAYPTSMVLAQDAAEDSPPFEGQSPRFSYTAAEIGAVETIGTIHPPAVSETIYSDHPYRTLYNRVGGYEGSILPIGPEGAATSSPIVYRDYQETGQAQFRGPEDPPHVAFMRPAGAASVCRPERNVVYANDQVRLCLPTEASREVSS